MSEQLVFDLPHRPALEADDFLVSDCNAEAVQLVDAWPDWTAPVKLIVGPAGCGKSHLANVWLLRSGARRLAPSALDAFDASGLGAAKAVLLEDLDRADYTDQALFHFLNSAKERGVDVLVTARARPAYWQRTLPDLVSRLRSLPVVTIGGPDDALLRAVLLKQFTDRQLDIEPSVIAYLATRMERSMSAVRRLVDAVDRAALAAGRKITRQFAGEVLAGLAPGKGSDGS